MPEPPSPARGISWQIFQRMGAQMVSLVAVVLIARHLSTGEFGVFAMALTAFTALTLFSDFGIAPALVQRRQLEKGLADATFFASIAAGVALALLALAASGPFAALYNAPQVRPIIVAFGPILLLDAVSWTHRGMARRRMEFSKLAWAEMCGAIGGGIIAVWLAAAGFGVWSLVGQAAGRTILRTSWLLAFVDFSPSIRAAAWKLLRVVWPMTGGIASFASVRYLTAQGDRIVVGLLLGPAALGIYAMGQQLIGQPLRQLTAALGGYMFPRLSRLQDDRPQIASEFQYASQTLLLVLTPIGLMAGGIAGPLAQNVMGSDWGALVPYIWWFVGLAIVQCLLDSYGPLLLALARMRLLVMSTALLALLALPSMAAASGLGLGAVLTAAVAAHVGAFPITVVLASRATATSALSLLRPLVPGFVGLVAAGIVLVAWAWFVGVPSGVVAGAFLAVASVIAATVCDRHSWGRSWAWLRGQHEMAI